MTPKEKAIEIINLFKNVPIYISKEPTDIDETMAYIDNDAVKQCALIAVDEIIQYQEKMFEHYWIDLDWWKKVKQEIDKL